MTAIQKTMRSMRIIALPLTRPTPHVEQSLPASQLNAPSEAGAASLPPTKLLTYYHFQITSPPPAGKTDPAARSWVPEGGVVKWVAQKAAAGWAGFGKAPEGSLKLKTFQYGERLVDRIDFEELALKGIDPSLGLRVEEYENEAIEKGKDTKSSTIPLIHPPSINSSSASLAHLRSLIAYRTPRHRKGFYVWMIAAPLTAPFMIIPIIPNLPFFFCVWRSWSHYRAYRASQYLESLLESGAIIPQASKELDAIYTKYASLAEKSASSSPSSAPPPSEKKSTQQPLLTRDAVPAIVAQLQLKESAGSDMYRAVEQARVRVKAGLV